MKRLCTAGLLALTLALTAAGEPPVQLPEGRNLLSNPTLRADGRGGIAPWRNLGEKKGLLLSHEAGTLILRGETPEFHHGIRYDRVTLKPATRYRFAAIMAGELQDGAKVLLLSYVGTRKYDGGRQHRGNGGTRTASFPRRLYLRDFETPSDGGGTYHFTPVSITGRARVVVTAVGLVELGPAENPQTFAARRPAPEPAEAAAPKPELPDMTIELGGFQPVNLAAHVGEKPAPPPDGCRVENRNGKIILDYAFTTDRHDAVMFDLVHEIPVAENLSLRLTGGKGHELFLVLYDRSGEAHYAKLTAIRDDGPRDYSFQLSKLMPAIKPYNVYASKWGGDGNQELDLPVKRITIGINDIPDTAQERGQLVIENLKIGKW